MPALPTLTSRYPICSANPSTAARLAMRASITPNGSRKDPVFRLIASEKIWNRGAAWTSRSQTFKTEMLAEEENFAGLTYFNRGTDRQGGNIGFEATGGARYGLDGDSVYGE
jgi:hypothetical protein